MDLKEEFNLPSKGKIYGKEITANYIIRAPRLCDKGIGDLSRRNKIQASVLKKCLDPTPEIDPYDWHTSDFTAANMAQRMAARGKDMVLKLRCDCGNEQIETIDLSTIKITQPKLPFDLTYTTKEDKKVELRFFTPRILDDIRSNIEDFKEQFPEADHDIGLQETCRALIVSVDGTKMPYSQMTNFLMNCYEVDLYGMIEKATATNFGPVLIQKRKCQKCKREIVFSISPDQG